MKKEITMNEVFSRGENYYTDEYKKTWRKDFELIERMTNNFTANEINRLYEIINGETIELLDMIQYIADNKN